MNNTYSTSELFQMNYNPKYGSNWINTKNTNTVNDKYKLYPTGDATLQSGRIYVALPANTIIDENNRKKYNII